MPATMNRLVKHLDIMMQDGPLQPEDYHFMICQCLTMNEWRIRKDNDRDYWMMQAWNSINWKSPEARNRAVIAQAHTSIDRIVLAWRYGK